MSSTPGEAFTQPEVDDFDLDAWLNDTKLPEKTVAVYGRADLVAEYELLDEQLANLRRHREQNPSDDRLSDRAQERRIAQQMAGIRAAMDSSKRLFRFRGLLKDEIKAITDGAPKAKNGDPDSDYVAAHWLAKACVSPAGMTPDRFQRLRAGIGEGQYAALWDAANDVTNSKRVSAPFSLAASAALSTPDS